MDRIALFAIIFWRNKIHVGELLPIFLLSRIPLLYANVPAESPSYAPTFFCSLGVAVMKFTNLCLLPLKMTHTKFVKDWPRSSWEEETDVNARWTMTDAYPSNTSLEWLRWLKNLFDYCFTSCLRLFHADKGALLNCKVKAYIPRLQHLRVVGSLSRFTSCDALPNFKKRSTWTSLATCEQH